MKLLDGLTFNDQGLVPVVIANADDNEPLTLCYMNRDTILKTLETGKVHVFRRSKGRIMLKGETSGHVQQVVGVFIDCEGRSLMMKVKQRVAGCHKGYMSCYFREYDAKSDDFRVTAKRIFDPEKVY